MHKRKDVLAEAVVQAEADIALYRSDRSALATLPLGRFSEAGVRSLLLRRLFLGSPLPLAWLIALTHLTGAKAASKAGGFAAELAYWRRVRQLLPGPEWEALTRGPVVLMYHAVAATAERPSRYIVSESLFQRQMAWLRARGYRLICLRDFAAARSQGLPPPRSVIVTLDDGYRDNGPALSRAGIPATIFVVTEAMGGTNRWDAGGALLTRSLLGWDDARGLAQSGIEVGAHSRTHPALPEVSPERLTEEVRGSHADLRRELGTGEYTFAYPHGRFDERTQEAVAAAGFAAACCSRGGVNDPHIPQFALRRVEIKGTDSFISFVLMVWLGRRITPLQLLRSLFVG